MKGYAAIASAGTVAVALILAGCSSGSPTSGSSEAPQGDQALTEPATASPSATPTTAGTRTSASATPSASDQGAWPSASDQDLMPSGQPTGGSVTPSASQDTAMPTPAASGDLTRSGPDLIAAPTTLGQIVVDGKGMTVYVYDKDVAGSGTSACTGACLEAWPPVTATSDTPAVTGVTGTISTIPTADGGMQITLEGMPLYTYAEDTAPGDVSGQGVGRVWWAVTPSGQKNTTTTGPMPAATGAAPTGSGY